MLCTLPANPLRSTVSSASDRTIQKAQTILNCFVGFGRKLTEKRSLSHYILDYQLFLRPHFATNISIINCFFGLTSQHTSRLSTVSSASLGNTSRLSTVSSASPRNTHLDYQLFLRPHFATHISIINCFFFLTSQQTSRLSTVSSASPRNTHLDYQLFLRPHLTTHNCASLAPHILYYSGTRLSLGIGSSVYSRWNALFHFCT